MMVPGGNRETPGGTDETLASFLCDRRRPGCGLQSRRRAAAERAARYKKKPALEPTEKTALASLFRFLLFLPPAGALLFWMLS